MHFVALIAGTVIGSLYDPFTWLAIFATAMFGWYRKRYFWVLLLVIAVTGAQLVVIYLNWGTLNIGRPWETKVALIGLSKLILTSFAWLIGVGLSRAISANR